MMSISGGQPPSAGTIQNAGNSPFTASIRALISKYP